MGGYKEYKIIDIFKRKNIIIKYCICIIIIFILLCVVIIDLIKEYSQENEIVYIEKTNLDYNIYLKENDFFEKKYLEKENQYIASLIDYIKADFKYELESDERGVEYKYTYKIVADVNVEEKTTQKSLYNFSEVLSENNEMIYNTDSKLLINEQIDLDYNKYNDLILKFIDLYDLRNCTSSVTINMYVNILDDNKENLPVMSLLVPLTTDTIAIDIESNEIYENSINVCKNINQRKILFVFLVILIVEIVVIVKLIIFIQNTKDEKSIYSMRLKKIMSNYGSYIQKLYNEFEFNNYQILEIKSFEDLLQIKETLNKPILMTEKESAMESYFFIPSDKICYIFELKAGNLRKNKIEIKSVEDINKMRIEEMGLNI